MERTLYARGGVTGSARVCVANDVKFVRRTETGMHAAAAPCVVDTMGTEATPYNLQLQKMAILYALYGMILGVCGHLKHPLEQTVVDIPT